ncbi:hypothetical protein HK104_004381 [Borealophlyctis nickersoniae]|nr:hypothetical protein HK104_004381 [Borealophlyctis nickersoniae]
MSKLFGKKENIFVHGGLRNSVIKKLNGTALTTAQMLDELEHVYKIKLQADGEINELMHILAERLRRDEFGLRNIGLDSNKLALFIGNTAVFKWFAAAHSDVARRIEAGLAERVAPPMSDAERIRELEEHNRQLLDALNNQQPKLTYLLPPRKRLRIAEREESSGGEESDGRDDKRAEDALEDETNRAFEMVEKEGRDDTGGEASAATNNVEVVPKDRETREGGEGLIIQRLDRNWGIEVSAATNDKGGPSTRRVDKGKKRARSPE